MRSIFDLDTCKVLAATGTSIGVSIADVKDYIQIAVWLATFVYIMSKTIKIWTKKKGKHDPRSS